MYQYYNPNPSNQRVGDCAVRAIAKATDQSWENAYINLVIEGLMLHDMPSANYVWGMVLHRNGFEQKMIESTCPACTNIATFAEEHPRGTYVVATQSHVVTIRDGIYYDSWDSGGEIIFMYWEKQED
jgi:hypothetical protein